MTYDRALPDVDPWLRERLREQYRYTRTNLFWGAMFDSSALAIDQGAYGRWLPVEPHILP